MAKKITIKLTERQCKFLREAVYEYGVLCYDSSLAPTGGHDEDGHSISAPRKGSVLPMVSRMMDKLIEIIDKAKEKV